MVNPEQKKNKAHPNAPPIPNCTRLPEYIGLKCEFVIITIAKNFIMSMKSYQRLKQSLIFLWLDELEFAVIIS